MFALFGWNYKFAIDPQMHKTCIVAKKHSHKMGIIFVLIHLGKCSIAFRSVKKSENQLLYMYTVTALNA